MTVCDRENFRHRAKARVICVGHLQVRPANEQNPPLTYAKGAIVKKLLLVMALVLALPSITANAGTVDDPEITDVAGDANFINGHGQVPGLESGPDTRPASLDNLDLRAIWFETAYDTTPFLDPATGAVVRVEYDPTALVIHFETTGPLMPVDPFHRVHYVVRVQSGSCFANLSLHVRSVDPPVSHGVGDSGGLCATSYPPGERPLTTIDGNAGSLTLPLWTGSTGPFIQQILLPGATLENATAWVEPYLSHGPSFLRSDEAVGNRDFVIGQDVPSDVDCTVEPANAACEESA